jgi:hypothetical protein
MQGVQMLYARWEKNKVVFDMSGANGEAFGNVEYNAAQPTITPETPTWEYDVEYYVDSFGLYDEGNLAKTFLGWYLDAEKVIHYVDALLIDNVFLGIEHRGHHDHSHDHIEIISHLIG